MYVHMCTPGNFSMDCHCTDHCGYFIATQDDVVLGTLTVRENLQFSAALRLPSHLTRKERKERVEKVIDELGLRACANTKVS